MPKRTDIKSVMVIGSGPIVIGQAAEFDYSGTQACRVLREEGIRVILVNSNPATIMTDPEMADATYIEPIATPILEQIIAKERPDALLPTLGGQTALNAAMALGEAGVLEKYNVELIGASLEAIDRGEDRELFKKVVDEAGAESARSDIAHSIEEVDKIAEKFGYPLVVRPSFTYGRPGLRHRPQRGGAAPHRRRRHPLLAHRRSPDRRGHRGVGRNSSSSSCATATTTSWSSARSRTSTRSACTPVTPSPWPPASP